MTRGDLLLALMRGVGLDVSGYRLLATELELQFTAALRHDADALSAIAERITAQVEALEARRVERVALAARLAGQGVRMDTLIGRVPKPQGPMLAAGWEALEALVSRCKALNVRNCRLMTDQHDLMQRVLGAEVQTYAPA